MVPIEVFFYSDISCARIILKQFSWKFFKWSLFGRLF